LKERRMLGLFLPETRVPSKVVKKWLIQSEEFRKEDSNAKSQYTLWNNLSI
jgi:hypothetical protein